MRVDMTQTTRFLSLYDAELVSWRRTPLMNHYMVSSSVLRAVSTHTPTGSMMVMSQPLE